MVASTAVRVDRWLERGSPVVVGVPGGSGTGGGGVPILTQQFGTNLLLSVQIAWGANLAADESTWTWVDVSHDVQYQQKVVIKVGRADWASTPQPATVDFTLDNRSGAYSKGPQSPNYPFVRRGTPIRVVVSYNGAAATRFDGSAVGFTPDWDTSGSYAVVAVQAAGSKRRLNQGSEVLQSTLRRSIPTLGNLVAYWPCEDGTATGSLKSAIGGQPLAISGTPQLAAYSAFACSSPIPTFATDSWSGQVPSYLDSGSGQVRFIMNIPTASPPPDQAPLISLSTAGSIARIELRYIFGGLLRLIGFDRTGATAFDSGTPTFAVLGVQTRLSVQWTTSGGNTTFTFSQLNVNVGSGGAGYFNVTATGWTVKGVTNISVAAGGNLAGVSIGQIYVQNQNDDIFILANQLNAFNNEGASDRIKRLCTEQGEKVTVHGGFNQGVMGPQAQDTFINLLEAAATVDQGYLCDGVAPGLTYFTRDSLENQHIQLPLAANLGQIEQPVTPVDDDQATINSVTAGRPNGATVTVSDLTGPLGVNAVGTYTASITANCEWDAALADLAGWRVHLGNLDEYRYPTLNLALHHHPELLPYWLKILSVLAGRVEVTGLSTIRKQHSTTTVRLFAEGWSETIDQFTWTIAMNCTRWEPWRMIQLAQDVGDTNEFLGRPDTDGSTTVGDTPVGATTMTVTTPTGPLWIQGSGDDFPLDVNTNGWQTTVSSIGAPLPVNANSTFEAGITPWTVGGGTLVQSSTQKHSGAFAAKVTPDGVSANNDIISEQLAITPGLAYSATAWVWFTSGVTSNYSTSIAWYDSTGTFISTASTFVSVSATTWTQVTGTFTAPGNAAFAAIVPLLQGTPAAAQIWYVDDVSVPGRQQVLTLASPTPADIPAGSPVSVWLPTFLTM